MLAALCLALGACRKPTEAVSHDLKEAGYELTAADWFKASSRDDLPALKKFVAAGFDIGTRSAGGDSALHVAATAGSRNAADFLLNRGLAINQTGANGRTPLMAAVLGDQTQMVSWFLRQGADARLKDKDGYTAVMLAVREGASSALAELAPHQQDSLDSALLLAALMGKTEAIDTLTKYGASIYTRMEDGRTPLMLAAQNGHQPATSLLLDLGSSRFSKNAAGQTAADLATAAGHQEIARLISRDPLPSELALESPAAIANEMDEFLQTTRTADDSKPASSPVRSIEEEILGPPSPRVEASVATAKLPLLMRHYRQRELPFEVKTVDKETVTFTLHGASRQEVKVRAGETIPGSKLIVTHLQRRVTDSKLNLGKPAEVSVVEVRDTTTGNTRDLISGLPAQAHDPVALVEDTSTGRHYLAKQGQRFKSADGKQFIISDVRPNQLVIEETTSGNTLTIPLKGPRG